MLKESEKIIIQNIVKSYPAELRLNALQRILKSNITPLHYVYLGVESGQRVTVGPKVAKYQFSLN